MTRLLLHGVALQFKILSRSAFDLLNSVFWPLVFATIAYYLYRNGSTPRSLFTASLGATVMMMWASVGVGCQLVLLSNPFCPAPANAGHACTASTAIRVTTHASTLSPPTG